MIKVEANHFFSLLVGLGYTQDIYEFVSFLTIPFHKGIPKESEKPPIYILGFVCLVIFYGFDPMDSSPLNPPPFDRICF